MGGDTKTSAIPPNQQNGFAEKRAPRRTGIWRLHPMGAQQLREGTRANQPQAAWTPQSTPNLPLLPPAAIWENKALFYRLPLVNKCRAPTPQCSEPWSRARVAFCSTDGACSAPTWKPAAPPCASFSSLMHAILMDKQRWKFSSPASAKGPERNQPGATVVDTARVTGGTLRPEEGQQGAKKPNNRQGTTGNCVRASQERRLFGQDADWKALWNRKQINQVLLLDSPVVQGNRTFLVCHFFP